MQARGPQKSDREMDGLRTGNLGEMCGPEKPGKSEN